MSKTNKVIWIAVSLLCIGFICFNFFKPFAAGYNSKTVELSPPDMEPFIIKVVDSDTGKGVPMIEVSTTNGARYFTDNAGYVSFYDPGLMNEAVFFLISGYGYNFPKESIGQIGQSVQVSPGGTITFEVDKTNIADRLYRITGQGMYKDSVALDIPVPIDNPILNAKVMTHSSAKAIKYNDMIYWFFGKTLSSSKAEANLRVTGATAELPENGGLEPSVGIDLNYFSDADGNAKALVPDINDGSQRVEILSLMTTENNGKEKLLAGFTSYSDDNEELSRGILEFDDQKEEFKLVANFVEEKQMRYPFGQTTLYEDNGVMYFVFSNPLAGVRVPADYDSILDQNKYEVYTPLVEGTVFQTANNTKLERDNNEDLVWDWKLNTGPINELQGSRLLRAKVLTVKDDYLKYFKLSEAETDKNVPIRSSSIVWSEYRNCWILLAQEEVENKGSGSIYYAEADAITGPWLEAIKIIDHTAYTRKVDRAYAFNNPIVHSYYSEDGGRYIYFEGTYSTGEHTTKPTSYYNDNQIMYRLDLDNLKSEPIMN